MYDLDEREKLAKRHRLIDAWEQKYGEPVPRVVAAFLLEAPPDKVVERFGDNPGPHIPPQEVGDALDTARLGHEHEWIYTIGWEDEPEFAGDPKSLAAKMVPLYRAAFERVHGRKPTAAELECEMAVGRGESMWGTAKYPGGLGPGMHNHGAVQCHKNCTDENSFQSWDTHPLDSGGSQRYDQRFRRYPSDEAGIEHLVKLVGRDPLRMLRDNGNLVAAFSLGMFGNRYYEMFNAPPDAIKKNQATYDWIREHATKPPPGASESFRKAMARAKDPIWAGRVLMHSIAINKHIDATTKALGVRRESRALPSVVGVGGKDVVVSGVGALIGMAALGGPVGAVAGALTGLAIGKIAR